MVAHRSGSVLSAVVAAAALAACDGVRSSPGGDFRVTVAGPSPLLVVGRLTAPVPFAVSRCDAFDAAVEAGGVRHAVQVAPQPDGTFAAEVPVEWLREEDRTCLDDALAPHQSEARLLVTCRDAGRTAAAAFTVAYGTATRAYAVWSGLPQAAIAALFPGADPLRPYALVPSALETVAGLDPIGIFVPFWLDGPAALQDPLARPRLAAGPSSLFLSSGCAASWSCPAVTVAPAVTGPGARLWGTSLSLDTSWLIWVPATVLDLAFMEDGTLIVLSQVEEASSPFPPSATVVTRVVPAATGAARRGGEVTVLAYLPGESARTGFSRTPDGGLAFLTFQVPAASGPLRALLHRTDGLAVTTVADATGDVFIGEVAYDASGGWYSLTEGAVQLSPDAASIVANGSQLGAPGGPFVELPALDPIYPADGDRGGVAWLDGRVALWKGLSFTWRLGSSEDVGAVEVFDAAPPHARAYGYEVHPLPGGNSVAQLYGATAVGDALVLTTNTGVRVLGPDGALVGGSDPLPCGLSPTSLAVATGATTFAVAAGDYVYAFDLAATP